MRSTVPHDMKRLTLGAVLDTEEAVVGSTKRGALIRRHGRGAGGLVDQGAAAVYEVSEAAEPGVGRRRDPGMERRVGGGPHHASEEGKERQGPEGLVRTSGRHCRSATGRLTSVEGK